MARDVVDEGRAGPEASVADPDNVDADPDPTSEKNQIWILLDVKFCDKKFLLKNGL
jgi:hypothetical protein